MKLQIEVAWPPKVLWSNGGRGNHRHHASATSDARTAAFYSTMAAMSRAKMRERPSVADLGGDPIRVHLTVSCKAKGKQPDRMNCASSVKAHVDGMADALKIDDRHFDALTVSFTEERQGKMWLEIGE